MVALPREILVLLALLGLQGIYKLAYDYVVASDGAPKNSTHIDDRLKKPAHVVVSPAPPTSDEGPRDTKLGYLGHYERPGAFTFRVGDIVVHRGHGQIGVVAERFDRCQLSEAWHKANAPPGMTREQPFYTILVSLPGQKFTRHGAQSSHRRWRSEIDGGQPPAVQHPDVNRFFRKFDPAAARYEPVDEAATAQEIIVSEWDVRN